MANESPDPVFPPLLRGEAAAGADPFQAAVARARDGAEPGLLVWARRTDAMQAALVLAPEEPLDRAAGVLLAAPVAFVEALGGLAPPELAVHLAWPGAILVNGGACGRCRAAASTGDPDAVPDWLVVGIDVPVLPPEGVDGGERPDETCLFAEGCGGLAPAALLEAWARHMLVRVARWPDEGLAPVRAAWLARAWKPGEALPGGGIFAGIDERGGMLVEEGGRTALHPLTGALGR